MHYRTITDLNTAIISNLHKVPADIDVIVGIPRSGLLAANFLALHLHLPFTDVSGFLENRLLAGGERMKDFKSDIRQSSTVLVLDDSLNTGSSMEKVRNRLQTKHPDKNILFSAVFMRPGNEHMVDFHFETCPVPRVFEWNLMNHPVIEDACVDIDGVLCLDPAPGQNDDGENYLEFVENASPLLRIRRPIGCLVTNRLEKYRRQTEKWLKKHGIQYHELIMRDLPDKKARLEAAEHGTFKGRIYKKRTDSKLFVESSYKQSRDIARVSGKMVYCVDKRVMIQPNGLYAQKYYARRVLKKLKRMVVPLLF